MKILRFMAFVLVGFFLVVAALGSMMPKTFVVSRTMSVPLPPNEVFDVIADVGAVPTWRKSVAGVERISEVDGKPAFKETLRDGGAIERVIEESVAGKRFVTRVADPNARVGGTWTFTLSEEADGTKIVLTENGIVPNVLLRLYTIVLRSPATPIEDYLDDLAVKLGVPGAAEK